MSERGRAPGADERDGRPTAEYVAVVAVVAVVVLTAGGVAAVELLLDIGGTPQANVQAGASVTSDERAGDLTVAWTSNQNADVLLVDFEGGGEAMRVADATAGVNTTGDRVALTAVGDVVTFTEGQPTATPPAGASATPRTVRVVVTAAVDENEDGTVDVRTVIVDRAVEV